MQVGGVGGRWNAAGAQIATARFPQALHARGQSGKAGIAASVLRDGRIIATGENEVHLQSDPTKHAEMVAVTRAARVLGTTDMSECVMISTLQPCEMCLAALRFVGIRRVIFAATQARVAAKYFVCPHLRIEDFQNDGAFVAIGRICEDLILPLYATGEEWDGQSRPVVDPRDGHLRRGPRQGCCIP